MRLESHYPFVTRTLLKLYRQGLLTRVHSIEVEPEYGHVVRVEYDNNTVRIIKGNDVGLNLAAASEVARDKAYTKFLLDGAGFRTPRGRAFLLPWWEEKIMPRLLVQGFEAVNGTDRIFDYLEKSLRYPVYIKPVDGAQGAGVWRCHGDDQIRRAVEMYSAERVKLAIVEEAVPLPDFRLVVLRGELISAYARFPLSVEGDGRAPIATLLGRLQQAFIDAGRPHAGETLPRPSRAR